MSERLIEVNYRRDLWKLFAWLSPEQLGGVVEVGVAEGNFSADILDWPVRFPVVYLVDRWQEIPKARGDSANPQRWHDKNYQQVVTRTQRFGDRAVILRKHSVVAALEVPDYSLSLVYIDADHSYFGVLQDILAWFPKVKPGGYIAFHDYENPAYGVKKAVMKFCAANAFHIFTLPEDKPEDAGAYFQVN